jgi:hypothetical protein
MANFVPVPTRLSTWRGQQRVDVCFHRAAGHRRHDDLQMPKPTALACAGRIGEAYLKQPAYDPSLPGVFLGIMPASRAGLLADQLRHRRRLSLLFLFSPCDATLTLGSRWHFAGHDRQRGVAANMYPSRIASRLQILEKIDVR